MDQAPATTPSGALTPGLAALLDSTVERDRKDALYTEVTGRSRAADEVDGQLSLFDVSEDGSTLVAFDGQTL